MSADDPQGPILLCWDGSTTATRAIGQAAGIVGPGRPALVVLVHVPTEASRGILAGTSGPDAPVMGVTDAEELLDLGMAAAGAAGFDATRLRVEAEDKTGATLVALAEEHDAPLIVMGQRGHSGLRAAIMGTVSRDVVGGFHRPVLLVGETEAPA